MSVKLRSGIIGAGFMAEVHSRAVHAAGGHLSAVADHRPARAQSTAHRLGASRAVTSAEELIESPDVDVIHVCTPNSFHADLAASALAAGKHVICEKPLATSVLDAKALAEAATDSAMIATVPFVYRFYPSVREVRLRVARGDVGPLRLLYGTYLQDWLAGVTDHNWRVDSAVGGASRAFGDIGVHWCDLVEFVTGHRINGVHAQLLFIDRPAGATGSSTEDAAAVTFRTDHGALGSVLISQVSQGHKNRLSLSIDGENMSMSFDQESPESIWIGGRDQNTTVLRGHPRTASGVGRYNKLPAGHPQGYQDCFNSFVADTYSAIDGVIPDGLPTFSDGLRAAVLTEAVLASAAGNTWVDVPV